MFSMFQNQQSHMKEHVEHVRNMPMFWIKSAILRNWNVSQYIHVRYEAPPVLEGSAWYT